MTFRDMQKDFAVVRIPVAIRTVVEKRNETELLIFQVLVSCLENCADVEIKLDREDGVCQFLRLFKEDGILPENALSYGEDAEHGILSCIFDLDLISEDLKAMNEEFSWPIPSSVFDMFSNSSGIEVSEKRLQSREIAIQKVKRVGEVRSSADAKNTN